MFRRCALLACLTLSACVSPGGGLAPARYANPVLDVDFPDPTVIRAPDGTFYAYATQGGGSGSMRNVQVAKSSDLVRWQMVGDALPVKPVWASRTQDYWAPHVSYADGRYFLYYSAKPDAALSDDSRGLCLAVATADRPEGPFVDSGSPLECGPSFVNIDPMAFDDPATGKRWLYWGSGFGAIKVRELAPDRISFTAGSRAIDLVGVIKTDDANEYQRLVEGAWITRHDDYYYLFYSGDNCCGPKAHYAVMVARSRSATGPFEVRPSPLKVMLEANDQWNAPGHNSIIADDAGNDWIVYHAVDRRQPRAKPTDDVNTRRVLLIDRIVWKDGWPTVANGSPSNGEQPGPAVSPR